MVKRIAEEGKLDQMHEDLAIGELRDKLEELEGNGLAAEPSTLDEKVMLHRKLVELTPPGHRKHPQHLSNLAGQLVQRYNSLGRDADVQEAIALMSEVLEIVPSGDPARPEYLWNLALVLLYRFEWTSRASDLDEAARVLRLAADDSSVVGEWRDRFRTQLRAVEGIYDYVGALPSRFEASSDFSKLDRTISQLREALSSRSMTDLRRAAIHSELGIALWKRYKRSGALDDILESIRNLEQATSIDSSPTDLANSATALWTLAERVIFDKPTTEGILTRAITAFREALRRFPEGHVYRATYLSNLGLALESRHVLTGSDKDIDDAINVIHDAIRVTAQDHPDRAIHFTNLCRVLRRRFEASKQLNDLWKAIHAGKLAVGACPLGSPDRARIVGNLGEAYEALFEATQDSNAGHEAEACYSEAARSESSPIFDRIRPARGSGEIAAAMGDWASAADAMAYAVRLLPELAWRGLPGGDRLSYLASAGMSGLASNASASALATGHVRQAVERLELGRGVFFGQFLDLRTDLSDLQSAHPALARKLDDVRAALDHSLMARP
jgi:tetratricopeptide (TPR) repeat protein